jgi:hypothetical protein
MSESVDNGGESYSGSSRKYNQSSSARSSESPSSESHAYSQPQASSGRTPIEKDKVEEIKKLLRETESFLIQYAKTNFPLLKNEEIKADFRNVVLTNEKAILEFPTLNTLVTSYQKTYNSLPANEQQQDKNKLLMNGLNEFVEQKRQENSKLKYW